MAGKFADQLVIAWSVVNKSDESGSLLEIRPLPKGKLQGRRSKYAIVDEWPSEEVRVRKE